MAPWATIFLRRAVLPSMDLHMGYWSWKMRFDRWLESLNTKMQIGIAAGTGAAAFVFALPFLASESDRWLLEMLQQTRQRAREAGGSHSEFVSALDTRRKVITCAVLKETSFIPAKESASVVPS
ncbi:hypothetical protein DIPPA_18379 [Diplonema papillatum]|nr:hypothetical protein DIPPA_18379 [Diplonema papillatum]|eukprot:gene1217-1890_t